LNYRKTLRGIALSENNLQLLSKAYIGHRAQGLAVEPEDGNPLSTVGVIVYVIIVFNVGKEIEQIYQKNSRHDCKREKFNTKTYPCRFKYSVYAKRKILI